MSHVVDAKFHIRDLEEAERSAQELGGVLVRGQEHFTWYETWMNDWHDTQRAAVMQGRDPKQFGRCAHVIRLKDAQKGDYEVGLVRRPDGDGYDAVYDSWGPGQKLETAFGKDLSRLKEHYGANVAVKRLRREGYRVVSKQRVDGALKVKVER